MAMVEKLAVTFPENSRVRAFGAEASRVRGDMERALEWIDQAIELDDDPQYKVKKAWLLSRLLRRDEIPALVQEIGSIAAGDGLLLWQLGKLCYHHNRLPEAIEMYARAVAVVGEQADWRYDLAIARFYVGDFAGAETDLGLFIKAAPQSGAAIYLRSTLRRQLPGANHVADIQARLDRGFVKTEDEAAALYALAKEFEDLGEHGASVEALLAGARKKRSCIQYDIGTFRRTMDEVRRVQGRQALFAPGDGCNEDGAIFIVGMPRTGTTLAERLLLQSGQVANAGELTDFGFQLGRATRQAQERNPRLSSVEATMAVDFAELGRDYMRGARQMAGGSRMFIDKLPPNYLYCGMIHKALPNARIIHLVRDPLDSCYAIFKTLFFDAYDFSYDLEELAEYYLLYRAMMRHWHEAMPGVILDVSYEDLVSDTEVQARRIYEWCGLEWTDEALAMPARQVTFATASAAQVREPIHTRSVRGSRRHLDKLAPLVDRLIAAGCLRL